MCFTPEASAILAFSMFGVAAYEYSVFKCRHYSIGLFYIGLMEFLQVFQHYYLAVPEDDYEMCKHPMNIMLTQLGGGHIAFQPFFINWILQGLHRRFSLRDRIESDLIQKLQFLGGCWMIVSSIIAQTYKDTSPPSTPECPNYDWLRQGYDHALNFTTPNLLGQPCTFLPPTSAGHLGWVLPQYPTTYFSPSSSIHCFLMFFTHFCLFRTRPFIAFISFLGFMTGPVLAAWITPSVNEQGAIWCFNAVIQMIGVVIIYRLWGVPQETTPKRIIHEGKQGEIRLEYVLVEETTNNKNGELASNGKEQNGKLDTNGNHTATKNGSTTTTKVSSNGNDNNKDKDKDKDE